MMMMSTTVQHPSIKLHKPLKMLQKVHLGRNCHPWRLVSPQKSPNSPIFPFPFFLLLFCQINLSDHVDAGWQGSYNELSRLDQWNKQKVYPNWRLMSTKTPAFHMLSLFSSFVFESWFFSCNCVTKDLHTFHFFQNLFCQMIICPVLGLSWSHSLAAEIFKP